jgi:streptothricin acetyltransferase
MEAQSPVVMQSPPEEHIEIVELGEGNLGDINRLDSSFMIDSRLVLRTEENGDISYTVENLPPLTKHYPVDEIDYSTYIRNPAKAVYLAYVDGQFAGQVILRKNWNNYAYIEWIVVDAGFRKLGTGRMLMERAISWAKERHLPGIMLETQDNNVAACKFYESFGFKLGGFDRFLYRAIPEVAGETALFWYLVF